MDISQFDPATFLDATTTEAATRRPPLPVDNPASEDHLYIGVIGEVKIRAWQGTKDPTKSGLALDIPLLIDVPAELQEKLKLQPQITLTDSSFLDLTPQNAIDWAPGKNRKLRIYRDATGMNEAGKEFSFRMLQGRPVKVLILHEMYEGDTLDKVKTVFKA